MSVMYAGVSACGHLQNCLAQCPKYLIVFFCFHLDLGNWENPGPFLLKASVTFICVDLIYSCDPVSLPEMGITRVIGLQKKKRLVRQEKPEQPSSLSPLVQGSHTLGMKGPGDKSISPSLVIDL